MQESMRAKTKLSSVDHVRADLVQWRFQLSCQAVIQIAQQRHSAVGREHEMGRERQVVLRELVEHEVLHILRKVGQSQRARAFVCTQCAVYTTQRVHKVHTYTE
jgi:hypothetical protein